MSIDILNAHCGSRILFLGHSCLRVVFVLRLSGLSRSRERSGPTSGLMLGVRGRLTSRVSLSHGFPARFSRSSRRRRRRRLSFSNVRQRRLRRRRRLGVPLPGIRQKHTREARLSLASAGPVSVHPCARRVVPDSLSSCPSVSASDADVDIDPAFDLRVSRGSVLERKR